MLAGWRGRIGRIVPQSVVNGALNKMLISNGVPLLEDAYTLREGAKSRSVAIAHEMQIPFTQAVDNLPYCVASANWPQLRDKFTAAGLFVTRLHEQHSYAASEAWSVGTHKLDINGVADLRGAGAIWQVFPGQIEVPTDAQDFCGKIDAVYTWVDADDPQWAAAYQRALVDSGRDTADSSVNRARFETRDELKYSLRSLELNMPWIETIYLVTAGQCPAWLKEDHPKLVLVDHQEIFTDPESSLPTFNSHAIESQLANIPNLAEHFIYINDDVFFGRYLHPNTFFGPAGQAKYCLTTSHFAQAAKPELPVNQAAGNNRQMIVERFGRTTSRKFQHVAHPQRLEVHRQLLHEAKSKIVEIAGNRFRSADDLSIPSSLAHHYAAQLGLGYPTTVNYSYIDIGSSRAPLDFLRLARNKDVDMFCINEVLTLENSNDNSELVREFLAARFPLPSSFEAH
ncbi:stealth family protein [Glutamicibacter arilaitensis]|uniref:stealth family protein n=1 Tax=Glutamicibacter arilaitensis TaxID=256701 RepID=UPI003FD184B2